MGLSVWAAASVAAKRGVEMLRTLDRHRSAVEQPAPVALELGAGGALPSLLAALDGQQILATDGDADVVRLMRRNFALNGLLAPRADGTDRGRRVIAPRKLDWTNTSEVNGVLADWPRGFPLIIAAEVFWNWDSMEQFFASVPKLLDRTQRFPPPSLLLAVSDDLFLDLATHAATIAACHGLRLVAQESVTGPSVTSSVHGTVLREDKATLLTFCHEHVDGSPMEEAAQQKQARQTMLTSRRDKNSA